MIKEALANIDTQAVEANASAAEKVLKAMANRQRLLILCHLARGEMSVSQLNEQIPLSQSALSQHLARLRQDGMVKTRREAQSIYYSLKQGLPARIISVLYSHYCLEEAGEEGADT
jgi:DNA-binding transcriptional ArsR family regulator